MLKGLTLPKFVSGVYVRMFCFMFAKWLVLWTDLTKGLCIRRVLKCVFCLWPEFDCPEVTLCG